MPQKETFEMGLSQSDKVGIVNLVIVSTALVVVLIGLLAFALDRRFDVIYEAVQCEAPDA